MLNGGLQRYLLIGVAVFLLGCDGAGDSGDRLSQVGETCSKTGDCDSGLVCMAAVCQQEGAVCPDDKECSGLLCGPDPVCGTSCGTCKGDQSCTGGECLACVPSCGGKECGDDGCGGSCGTCSGDQTCETGQCVGRSSCEPNCGTPGGLKWVSIPGGTFEMGCSLGDDDCFKSENPPHSVTVSSFQMLETEVTEAQYEAVMDGNPSHNYGGGGGADNPVDGTDWSNAKTFCEGIGGRLPTEAEWEFAARAGTATKYYCGDDAECLNDIAWYDENSSGMKHSVKKKEPNAYGLYDMLGNVREWTNDWFDSYYYESSPSSNPQGPDSGYGRVHRGSSFFNSDDFYYTLSVSRRDFENPLSGGLYQGFRCARSE